MLIFLPRPRDAEEKPEGEEKKPPLPDAAELHFLDPATLQLRRQDARLQCRFGEEEDWQEATVLSLFPRSTPLSWLSLQNKEGKEFGVLENVQVLSGEQRQLLEDELSGRYLMPRIVRLLSRRQRFDVYQWTAQTTRGKVTFLTRGLRDQVQQPLPGHFIFTDVEGNRYEIADLGALDPQSRRLLEDQL